MGLQPGRRNSGQSEPQMHISKEGDPYLRSLLMQATHHVLGPWGVDSDLRRWGMKLAEHGGKRGKKRAVVPTTDPESTYATKGGTPARMGYCNNYLIDNHSCIVVGVQATGARLGEESRAAQDMIARFIQWQERKQQSVAADTSCGNGEFSQWLMDRKSHRTCGRGDLICFMSSS